MQAGTIIGGNKYCVVSRINQGGMGVVYMVDDPAGTRRALKLIAPSILGHRDHAVWTERFLQEARIVLALKSPHIVEVVDAGVDPECGPYIVMELLSGDDLHERLNKGGRPLRADARCILEGVASALACAHAAGVVHRDLKPANVHLSDSGRTVKLLDFGIAKIVEGGENTMNSVPMGTCAWMAPEQLVPGARIDARTDVWAFGLLAFQLLTGKPFWRSHPNHPPGIIQEVCHDPLPTASVRATELGVSDHLPVQFDNWFVHCVNRDMAARFSGAAAAIEALSPMLRVAITRPTPTPPPATPIDIAMHSDPVDASINTAIMQLRARIPMAIDAMHKVTEPRPVVEPRPAPNESHRNARTNGPSTPTPKVWPPQPPPKPPKIKDRSKPRAGVPVVSASSPAPPALATSHSEPSTTTIVLVTIGVTTGMLLLFTLAFAWASLARELPVMDEHDHHTRLEQFPTQCVGG